MQDIKQPELHQSSTIAGNVLRQHRSWYWAVFLLVAAVGLFILLFVNYQFSREDIARGGSPALTPAKLYRVQFEFAADKKRAFEGPAEDGMRVQDAISRVAEYASLDVKIANDVVLSLDDQESRPSNHSWDLYINGARSSDGLSRLVSAGDRIVLRYE